MANYINSPILFESYVHLDGNFDDIEDVEEALRREINNYLNDRAKHFLYAGAMTEVKFKDGSIKAYATVRGGLRECLPDAYNDFPKEIDYLYWFAKRLSDAAVMEVAFKTGTYLRAIERTEARPGVIGRCKKIVDGLLSIKLVETEKSAIATVKRVRVIKADVDRLMKQVKLAEDVQLLKKEFLELANLIPARLGLKNVTAATEERFHEVVVDLKERLDQL